MKRRTQITPDERSEALLKGFTVVPVCSTDRSVGLAAKKDPATVVSACELILEGPSPRSASQQRRARVRAGAHGAENRVRKRPRRTWNRTTVHVVLISFTLRSRHGHARLCLVLLASPFSFASALPRSAVKVRPAGRSVARCAFSVMPLWWSASSLCSDPRRSSSMPAKSACGTRSAP